MVEQPIQLTTCVAEDVLLFDFIASKRSEKDATRDCPGASTKRLPHRIHWPVVRLGVCFPLGEVGQRLSWNPMPSLRRIHITGVEHGPT